MERSLGLMCGAGDLPARMAAEAGRQGWRVVAFTFAGASDVSVRIARAVPSRLTEVGTVLDVLQREHIAAVLLSGKFLHQQVLAGPVDATVMEIARRAGSMTERKLLDALVGLLAERGVEVLDQRAFLGDGLASEGCLSARKPTDQEWADIATGLVTARMIADAHIGQAVVIKRGAVVAVEAVEGTTEAIRRGTAVGGRGAVIVKAAAIDHDYRLDTPAIGPETVAAAVAGGATAIAVEAGRVLLTEREDTLRTADEGGLAVVGVVPGGR